jgi:hypothetical protein
VLLVESAPETADDRERLRDGTDLGGCEKRAFRLRGKEDPLEIGKTVDREIGDFEEATNLGGRRKAPGDLSRVRDRLPASEAPDSARPSAAFAEGFLDLAELEDTKGMAVHGLSNARRQKRCGG